MTNTTDDKNPIDKKEYKEITESMYKQNLELTRLYKQVENLNQELGDANKNLGDLLSQRESLMHLINHKVKGAFTRSKYIFASMLDGTFGEINNEIRQIAQQGLESDETGVKTIDLVLNASNMQKGTVKYDLKEINLKELVLNSIKSKQNQIERKGLELITNIKDEEYLVSADVFWLKEAVNNLIENSISYTKTGSITIALEKHDRKIIISVKDTGVGINEEDKKILFTEGGRGKDSVHVNVDSTGYGLYSVRLIVESHNGKVWVESEGTDKGSTFFIELPAV